MYISILQTANRQSLEKLIPSDSIIDITCKEAEETTGETRAAYLATIIYSNLVKITLEWTEFDLIETNPETGAPLPTTTVISSALNNAIVESVNTGQVSSVNLPSISSLTYE